MSERFLNIDAERHIVAERHDKISAIITKHLEAMYEEILDVDPTTMNIDVAGNKAEIARHVLDALVKQLRYFAAGARRDKAEDVDDRLRSLTGDE
jgi:hypothetical protein